MKKTKIFFAVIASLILCSITYAQVSSDTAQARYVKYPWAMQFSIRQSFTLSSFRGSVFAFSRHISEKAQIRVSLSASFGGEDIDQSGSTMQADTVAYRTSNNGEASSTNISLTIQHLIYLSPGDNTNFFVAVGPTFSLGWSRTKINIERLEPSSLTSIDARTTENNSYSIGALGSAGVEWFPSDIISLHAEYGLQFSYRKSETENTQSGPNSSGSTFQTSDASNVSSWSVSEGGVLFGLSMHF